MRADLLLAGWGSVVGLAETSIELLSLWFTGVDTWVDMVTVQESLRQLLSFLNWLTQFVLSMLPQGVPGDCFRYRWFCSPA